MSRPFTPREPARSRLMGAEAVRAMSWHDTVEPLDLDEFQLELNAVVFDALTVSRARQSPATITRNREQVDSIAIGASFYFVRSGSFVVEQGDQRFTAGPGTAFQLSGFEPFTLINTEVIDVSLVVMSRGIFDSVGYAEYEGLSRKLRPTPLTRAVTHFLTGLSSDLPSPETVEGNTVKETLRGLIIGILQSAIHLEGAEEAKIPAILAKATSAISQNYSNPALRTSDIAEASGVSVRHLQRLLALSDSSVAAQLKERRLAAATALLTDPNWSASTLESIASATGFGSVSRMRRTFQSEFGVNPTEFRASAFKPEPTHAFLR